jgi:hypothetical protein
MEYIGSGDLEQQIIKLAGNSVLIAGVTLLACAAIAVWFAKNQKKIFKKLKLPLFALMATALVGSTILLFASTVYLNVKSESKGPVHWHADIEFWACGTEVELRDPRGALSNKIGTATFHEHNDKRIHLEGVVVKKSEDASLEKFMRVTGGFITSKSIGIPLNDQGESWAATPEHQDGDDSQPAGFAALEEYVTDGTGGEVLELGPGKKCDNQAAELQTFVYRYDKATKTYSQSKLEDPKSYIMRDEATVPPGDCVIVEFDKPKARTNKLCEQYGVRDTERCTKYGVKEYNPDLCNLHEVGYTGGRE